MMHMTFYWGIEATILFDGWKTSTWTDYSLSLLSLFLVSALYQYLSSFRLSAVLMPSKLRPGHGPGDSLLGARNTLAFGHKLISASLFGIRVGIGYLLMLAAMSFNAGVFIAIVLGFSTGHFCSNHLSPSVAALTQEEVDVCCP